VIAFVKAQVIQGFDDLAFGPGRWEELLSEGETNVIYLTWHWQRSWWEALGRGELLLVGGEKSGRIVALAPFYTHCGMVFFVGSGESDYLDFIGDISDPDILDAILGVARDLAPDFTGFRFYGVLSDSRTGKRLKESAHRLGLECFEEAAWPAPVVDLANAAEAVQATTNGKRLLKRERFFRRHGLLELRQFRDGQEILPQLEEFFNQHISRWEMTSHSSPFLDQRQRAFIEQLTRTAADTGWPRFTRLDWNKRAIAFEYGWCYRDSYYGGPSCFAPDLARYSPGQVLLRQLLLAAMQEGVSLYDFGCGDEPYKTRFATHVGYINTWGLYPIGVRS
jgi:CelD/BcsL family acetyltransferase involved in cellulose biosynthesis